MRIIQEDIDTVELHAVDLRFRSEVEHRVEIDVGFGAAHTFFADETGPHRVVELGIVVLRHVRKKERDWRSGFVGSSLASAARASALTYENERRKTNDLFFDTEVTEGAQRP